MELKWNKFVQEDKNSYPKNSGDYMVFCIYSCTNGNWSTRKCYCYFDKQPYNFYGKNFAGHFDISDSSTTILYWAEVPDPEEFKKDFPF